MAEYRPVVRGLYRRLFRRILALPPDKRAVGLVELRESFRASAQESDPAIIEQLVQKGNSRLAFLRMITPAAREERGGHAGTYVVRDGALHEGRGTALGSSAVSGFTGTNIDPEQYARHQRLVERQHFGGRR